VRENLCRLSAVCVVAIVWAMVIRFRRASGTSSLFYGPYPPVKLAGYYQTPLRDLLEFSRLPRLTPWAKLFRRSAAASYGTVHAGTIRA
jgi:hypothetical protein